MKFVSPILKRVVYPIAANSGYLRRNLGAGPAVVTYHGVCPAGYRGIDPALDGALVTAESLRRQVRLLKSRYNVISPDQFLHWWSHEQELPERSVLLTCDDGLRNTLMTMVPLLAEEKVQCLFFVTAASATDNPSMLWYEELYLMLMDSDKGNSKTGKDVRKRWLEMLRSFSSLDQNSRREALDGTRAQMGLTESWCSSYWDDSSRRDRFALLEGKELLQLLSTGMTIGSHTRSHPVLSQQPVEAARQEIAISKSVLEQALGREVWAFAYPFGDEASVTRREQQLAEQAGYRCAFMNIGGGFGAEMTPFAIPRVHVTAEMTLAEFEAHVAGFHRTLQQRFGGWRRGAVKASQEVHA